MRKSSIILLSAACVAALVAIFAIGVAVARMRHASGVTVVKAASAPSGTPAVVEFASDPALAPAFTMKDLAGETITTSAFPGKVVLLSFWATWCPPCRLEIPELIDLQKRYKDKLQIIGISMDDTDTPAEIKHVHDVATELGINYPVILADQKLIDEYGGVPALPTTFVLNTNGRVVQKHTGLYDEGDFDTEIRLLANLPVNAKVKNFEDTGQIFLQNAAKATELPGVDFSGLTPEKKRAALKRMNAENCTCGCGLTIAECRVNDTECDISKDLAAKIVKEVKQGSPGAQRAVKTAATQ
ncbi:MAG TPA: TlpA disulfide reductase family protein [Candidatus Binatia bacterium]|nr:TlpA disulfide reductase family protein [Candidatus Binatia bacterium]